MSKSNIVIVLQLKDSILLSSSADDLSYSVRHLALIC